ncbi:MAG: A/G-specific adenine glycosylase, partial [Candidatus Andersenbacteria bacterium]
MTIPVFQKIILEWYQENKRDLPWRKTHNPYQILVSEIMLQQTQVSRVIPKYQQFLQEFPTPEVLAKAPDSKLLTVWSGLGYWRRAKFLKAAAQAITNEHNGVFPQTPEELVQLPGIGPYTAGAVACFAFNHPGAFIDTNIRRVYLHFFFPNKEEVSDTEILTIAQQAVWKKDPRTWHWALFDYGASELKTKGINRRSKHYARQSKFTGSFRSYRTAVVKQLLATPNHQLSKAVVLDFLEDKLRTE